MTDMITPWFEDYHDVFDGYPDFRRFLELEDAACAVLSWQPDLIPGLLQTRAYASVVATLYNLPGMSDDEIARCVALRMARKRHLETHHLDFIIGENVLTDARFPAEVMSEQRTALASVLRQDRPNVTLRVCPAQVGSPEEAFVVLRFPDRLDVLYLERGARCVFEEGTAAVGKALVSFQELVSASFKSVPENFEGK